MPKAAGRLHRCARPRRRRPLGVYADIRRSKSIGDTVVSSQTSTPGPIILTPRWVALGRVCRLGQGAAGTFFKPRPQGIAGNPKHAADRTHRHPLLVGLQHLFPKHRRMYRRSKILHKGAPITLAPVTLSARRRKLKFHRPFTSTRPVKMGFFHPLISNINI